MVVEKVDAVSDFHAQSENCGPLLAVKELCLRVTPKRFDHGVVKVIPNCSATEPEAILGDISGKGRSSELGSVVGVTDSPAGWLPRRVRHEQSPVHQTGFSSQVNCPADSVAGKHIQHCAGINSAFPGGVFRDVGDLITGLAQWR